MEISTDTIWSNFQKRMWEFLNIRNPENFKDDGEVMQKGYSDFFTNEEKEELKKAGEFDSITTSAWNVWGYAKDNWRGYNGD